MTSSIESKIPPLSTPPTREVNADTLPGKGVVTRSTSSVPHVQAASASVTASPLGSLVNALHTSSSNLANLLPTGTFLAFSAVAPVVTDNGNCNTAMERTLSVFLLAFFAVFCIFSCFTDSYQAKDGKVYYGIVTVKGLWIPQLPEHLHPGDKQQYKLTFTDVVHSILSPVVFGACWVMTPSFQACFYGSVSPSMVMIVPASVGCFVSSVFVAFPSSRRGVGFPVSPASLVLTEASSEEALAQQGSGSGCSTSAGSSVSAPPQLVESKNPV